MALTVTEILAPVGQGATPATTLTGTFTAPASVGDYIFVTVLSQSVGTLPTPTDSAGNTYVLDQQDSNTTTSMRHGIARCLVRQPIVSGVTTISLTFASQIKGMSAVVVKSPGLLLELDKTNKLSSQATNTTMTTGASGSLITPLEFAIASYAWGNTSSTFTETAGWTNPHGAGVKISTTSTVFESATQYFLPSANTSLNPAATLGTTNTWSSDIITYRIMNQYAYKPVLIPNNQVGPPALRQLFRQPQLPQYLDAAVTSPSVNIAQLAGTITAAGGTQTVTSASSVAIDQTAAIITATGGTQLATTNSSNAQVAAVITATGGTQTVATVNNVSITQVAAIITANGGTQTVTTVNDVAISQSAATITANGGTQVITTVNNVAITQVAGVITASGGTQVISTVNIVSVSQLAGVITVNGGTQAVSAGSGGATSVTVSQVAAILTASGGTQVSQSSTGPVNNYPKLIYDIDGNPYLRVTAHEYLKL